MKRIFLLMIATCIFGFAAPILARDIELTVTLDTSEYYKSYEYDEFWDVGCYYLYGTKHTNYKLVSHGTSGEIWEPWLPWCMINVQIQPDEEYVSLSYSIEEKGIRDTLLIGPIPALSPTSADDSDLIWDGTYVREQYPTYNVKYLHASVISHWDNGERVSEKYLYFYVCPFIYIPQNKILESLVVKLTVTVVPIVDGITSPSDQSVNSRSAQGDASHLKNSVNSNFLDLSGRHFPTLPTRKGIYIKDGRKVLIK